MHLSGRDRSVGIDAGGAGGGREGGQLTMEPIGDLEYDRESNDVSTFLLGPRVNLTLVNPTTLDLPYQNWLVGPVVHANGPVGGVGIFVDNDFTRSHVDGQRA